MSNCLMNPELLMIKHDLDRYKAFIRDVINNTKTLDVFERRLKPRSLDHKARGRSFFNCKLNDLESFLFDDISWVMKPNYKDTIYPPDTIVFEADFCNERNEFNISEFKDDVLVMVRGGEYKSDDPEIVLVNRDDSPKKLSIIATLLIEIVVLKSGLTPIIKDVFPGRVLPEDNPGFRAREFIGTTITIADAKDLLFSRVYCDHDL